MKRAILGMLEENYDFEQSSGTLKFSCENVELSFIKNEQREGTIEISSSNGNWMEGYIFSNNFRMRCLTDEFSGNLAEILYCFDSTGMEPGELQEGEFHVVSNFGEYTIPFSVRFEQEFLFSSMGPIKNLFHFANLAQTDWAEAVNLFYSPEFSTILKGNEEKYLNIYRGLSAREGNQKNVESFLIAVKKKTPITYKVDTQEINIDDAKGSILREISVMRSGWGCSRISVICNEPFLRLEKNNYGEDDFLGNICRIPVYIEADRLHEGKNMGCVTILDGAKIADVYFTVRSHAREKYLKSDSQTKLLTAKLTHLYIDFRTHRMELSTWAKESMRLVDKMTSEDDKDISARLYQAQLLIATGRISEAKWILQRVEEFLDKKEYAEEQEAYFYYLKALCDKDNADYIDKITHRIRKMYHKADDNWRLSWVLLYLQEDLCKSPSRKWEFLEEQYNYGAFSPILYIEAVTLLKENPSLLIKISSYELQLTNFLIRTGSMTAAITERIQFLCGREREYNAGVFRILSSCYQLYPSKELLQVICSYLMKGNKVGKEFFSWYEAGVKEELRLTRLYDFYMMSIDLHYEGELPKIVMMYFAYQNNLPYERMAFLYAKVLSCEKKYPEIVMTYAEAIDSFIRDQLSRGRINDNLAYLYRKAVLAYMIDDKISSDLAPMMFMKRIRVTDESLKYAIVIHKKVIIEKMAPSQDGVAYLPIYSKDYEIMFENTGKDRITAGEGTQMETLEFPESLRKEVLNRAGDKLGVLLNVCEGKRDFVTITEDNVFGYARLLRSEVITPEFQKEILLSLVKYYFDNDCVRELDELLDDINPKVLCREERRELIRILVARGMYDKAFSWICTYGPESAQEKTLLRLCSRLIERRDFEEDLAMLLTSSYIFRLGKYDQTILAYMVRYFRGSTKEMKNLWNAANSFGVENYILLEHLIVQMLYSDTFIGEKMALYEEFEKNNGSSTVEKAFLAKCSYDFFVKDSPTGDCVFRKIEQLLEQGESMNRVCRLALLKFYTEQPMEEINQKLATSLVTEEIRCQHCFPMFSAFHEFVPELSLLMDKTFIEYHGSMHSRVILHYVLEKKSGEEEYRKEEMCNMYGGIFVKGFVLFYGETIQYYITEENGNCEQLTQSSTLQRPENSETGGSSRFELLNDIVLSKEIKDYDTCRKLMNEYAKQNFVAQHLF